MHALPAPPGSWCVCARERLGGARTPRGSRCTRGCPPACRARRSSSRGSSPCGSWQVVQAICARAAAEQEVARLARVDRAAAGVVRRAAAALPRARVAREQHGVARRAGVVDRLRARARPCRAGGVTSTQQRARAARTTASSRVVDVLARAPLWHASQPMPSSTRCACRRSRSQVAVAAAASVACDRGAGLRRGGRRGTRSRRRARAPRPALASASAVHSRVLGGSSAVAHRPWYGRRAGAVAGRRSIVARYGTVLWQKMQSAATAPACRRRGRSLTITE